MAPQWDTYDQRVDEVRRALGDRSLFWFGIRGEDARPLIVLEQFRASFAITAPFVGSALRLRNNVVLEDTQQIRVDLDRYDLDFDLSDAATRFRNAMRLASTEPSVMLTYRPNGFVSSLGFAMAESLRLAGMLKDRQSAFEFKPWVETSLSRNGVETVNWRYVPDSERARAKAILRSGGPQVLRVSRASGGVGMVVAVTEDDIDEHWPEQRETFIGVAPYLAPTVPVNFSGCVFPNGTVRLHPASLQLISIQGCTSLRFGYCGNDFGAVVKLNESLTARLDEMGRAVGAWLAKERYVGAFGIDAMIHDGRVLFTEVNARFQGSSSLSASVTRDMGFPDLYFDHLAAFLDVEVTDPGPSLTAYAEHQRAASHVVIHNPGPMSVWVRPEASDGPWPRGIIPLQIPEGIPVEPGGVLARLVSNRAVTSTGFDVDPETALAIKGVLQMAGLGYGGPE